ncbi:MAG: trypsin-like peptidase domain-containing protein [Betaproteobacteria bacterium]
MTMQDRPLTSSEIRDRRATVEAMMAPTEQVPAALRNMWSDLSVNRRAPVQFVERDSVERPGSIAGHRPPWVGASLKPKAAVRRPAPRVVHRGVGLEPMVVWGADDRRVYSDVLYPWVCVCRIETSGGVGSGVIIGPRHVLTASHVIDWNTGAATIEVHRAGGMVLASAQAEATWSYTRVIDNDSTTLDEDYAVIVTDQRLGDRFGFFGVRTYDSDWDDEPYWRSIGYPTDIAGGNFPVYQRDKSLDEDEWDYGSARAMTTSADVMKGQSGSPIFGFWGNDPNPYVVAVVAATGSVYASGTENWCSGGSLLTRLVDVARTNDP